MMRLTLKNYRCFEESSPLVIDFASGFVGFIGPNNSGKSTALKALYELRPLFNVNEQLLIAMLNHAPVQIGFAGVDDPTEIANNKSRKSAEIILEFEVNIIDTKLSHQIFLKHNGKLTVSVRFRYDYIMRGDLSVMCDLSVAQLGLYDSARFEHVNGIIYADKISLFAFGEIKNGVESYARTLYVGPFRNAINQGAAAYFDLQVGESFVQTWNSWKTGANRNHNQIIGNVCANIQRIFGLKGLEITATNDNKQLHVVVDGKAHRLRELGSGLAQFILTFSTAAIHEPDYLLIDEPELNLHPSLQIDFITSLAAYAKRGVLFSTHSMGLARSVADKLFSLQRRDGVITARPFEKTPNYAEFLGTMGYCAYQELGFDKVLLVEGQTEVKVMHQFLRKIGKDHQVVVLPLGGRQMIKAGVEIELGEIKRLGGKVYAVIDSERSSAGEALGKDQAAFLNACESLGFFAMATDRRATENYFSEQAIKAVVGENFRALAQFEKLKGSKDTSWSKSENWRIAREVEWEDIKQTDLGIFLEKI